VQLFGEGQAVAHRERVRKSIACNHATGSLIVLLLLAGTLLQPLSVRAQSAGKTTSRKPYSKAISRQYDYCFGSKSPFRPSNAEVEGDRFIPPGAFPTAAYCGYCHAEAYKEWSESAHRNSFRAPFYKKNVDLLINGKGIASSRHCEGCHNPIALFSGALTPGSRVNRSFDDDGVTCSVCHSITRLQPSYGVGSYVMGIPAVMVDEKGHPIPGTVPYQQILKYPDRHRQAVMRDIYKSPEFCGSCHEANLPRELNGYKWLRAIGTYDEWQHSAFAGRSPLPFYKVGHSSCQDCHMSLQAALLPDLGAKNGMLASHRWLGGNTALPFYYGDADQLKATETFLANQRVDIDIFALKERPSGKLIAPLGLTDFAVTSGTTLQAVVVIRNKGLGHSLIPEQRDFFEAWVEFVVKDESGREIFHSGYIESGGNLERHAHSFTNRLIDENGNLLSKHEVWERRAVAYDKTVQSGRSTIVRYEFPVPATATSALTVTARVNYRHFNQSYLDFVLGPNHPAYPVVKMAEESRIIQIGANSAEPNPADKTPEWMRWNNYGIARLDEGLYKDAVDAFKQVVALRPDYADGATNIGLAELRMEKYAAASQQFTRALELDPHSSRAQFYRALTERSEGQLGSSAEDLTAVAKQFPVSADVHRELGICYYLLHRYDLSSDEFKSVQAQEPDDLTAHYYLSILYRRLGTPSLAEREAALYEDEKNDPAASTISLRFLDANRDLYSESLPSHTHFESGQLNTASADRAVQDNVLETTPARRAGH
jgi:tetratricopeptide (TPR) repeat protein